MVIITEPYQTAYINLISVKQNYSILILSYNPCNHCSRNCTMGKFASRHHSQSFIIEIVHYSIFCSECFILFIHGCMKKVQLLSADHFFFMDYSKQVEILVLRSPVYRGAAYSSASIAWSGSKLTSWFERSGNLDGDSVSPYPRMPGICRDNSGEHAVYESL